MYQLMLAVLLLAGHPTRLREPLPWTLTVTVTRAEEMHFLMAHYGSEEECSENAAVIAFTPLAEGVTLVNIACEREPFTV